jgi:hypothetical protein
VAQAAPFGPVPRGPHCKRSYLHCPTRPSHVDDDVVELLLPPLFCVVDVMLFIVVHPEVLLASSPTCNALGHRMSTMMLRYYCCHHCSGW